jgi:O-antigen ligase
MLYSLKEFVVVFVIAVTVFRVAKPMALLFIDPDDLSRRRSTWLVLTATAFFAPNFWAFALVAIPLTIWAGRKDTNPSAVYIMLFTVIPPVETPLPMIGMPYLLMMSNYLLLSFCVLTPLALRIYRFKRKHKEPVLQFTDYCLLAFGFLTAVLYLQTVRPEGGLYPTSITDCLRRGFVFFFVAFIPYFAISRAGEDRRKLIDMIATYCLCCALLAAVGMFESARQWLLYAEMFGRLGTPGVGGTYLMRGESLRAMASTGHAMALAYMLVPAYGLWLYLQSRMDSKKWTIGGAIVFGGGLFAAYTRGAWVGAVLVYFLFAALQPRSLSKLFKATGGALIIGMLIYLSPLGDKIVSVLPWFGGNVDNFNVIYRERLWDRSWQIIQDNPFLGDQGAMLRMQDLRQGEGIVDMVNTYVGILLDNGFVGLALFLLFILGAAHKAWTGNRKTMSSDEDLCVIGASLVACIIAMLVMFENGSFGGAPEKAFYILAGLATGYGVLARSSRRDPHATRVGINNGHGAPLKLRPR